MDIYICKSSEAWGGKSQEMEKKRRRKQQNKNMEADNKKSAVQKKNIKVQEGGPNGEVVQRVLRNDDV